jgi:anti-sigma regulatory factor (Ser/Thr protein kinase)
MRDGNPGRIEMQFKRSLDSLSEISEFLAGFFARQGIGPEHLKSVTLAAEELFTNMLKYGGGDGEILIGLERRDRELSVSLTDFDVDRFDVTKVPEIQVDRPLSERKPGGLGIHLIKKMMDRIEYEYVDRRGTTTFFKTLDG